MWTQFKYVNTKRELDDAAIFASLTHGHGRI